MAAERDVDPRCNDDWATPSADTSFSVFGLFPKPEATSSIDNFGCRTLFYVFGGVKGNGRQSKPPKWDVYGRVEMCVGEEILYVEINVLT